MSSAAASASASSNAAAEALRMRQEEEEMTPYSREELAGDWEFKILRSVTGSFKNPDTLQRVLEEEAQAGWILVEKFDNSRIRLKRPANSDKTYHHLAFDPYRTYVGRTEGQFALIIVGCIVGGLVAIGVVVAALTAMQ